MSQFDVKQVACHQCQAPIDVKVYETIDVTDQSPEREAILSGEFFKVKCPECGYEGMADYGFPIEIYKRALSSSTNQILVFLKKMCKY